MINVLLLLLGIVAIAGSMIWRHLFCSWLFKVTDQPPCHVKNCRGWVTHSHWPKDDPYDVQYFCPKHTGEHIESDRTYVVEPWRTELSDRAIHELIHSGWHWQQRKPTEAFHVRDTEKGR